MTRRTAPNYRALALTIGGTLVAIIAIAEPTLTLIGAVVISLAGLGVAAHTFREQRDEHQENAARLRRELDASNDQLAEVLDEHARCPLPVTDVADPDLGRRMVRHVAAYQRSAGLRP